MTATTSSPVPDLGRSSSALHTRLEVESFLYHEAALLDAWALDDWFALFAEDGKYVVPSTDHLDGDPDLDLALINEDTDHLAGRIQRLKSTWAHIENPHSRTNHLVTNVRVLGDDGTELDVRAGFVIFRSRPNGTTVYSGTYRYRLRRTEEAVGFAIVEKFVALVETTLRDSGGVLSILL